MNSINATLTIDHKFKDYRQVPQWAILIDTGAMTSVAPSDYCPHIPLKPLEAEKPQTVKAGRPNRYGIKQLTMLYNKPAIPRT
eukprot:3173145-Amphidinium_carterae.3